MGPAAGCIVKVMWIDTTPLIPTWPEAGEPVQPSVDACHESSPYGSPTVIEVEADPIWTPWMVTYQVEPFGSPLSVKMTIGPYGA